MELYKIIKEANVEFPLEPWYTRKIKFLIKECLQKDPNKRKSAGEILKILMVHKKESLEKYKPVFKKEKCKKIRLNSVDVSLQDIVFCLDFITNLKSAVFENPENKNEKIVLKNDKKLAVYDVPKERSVTKINKKNINVIQKTISISNVDEENDINNNGKSFTVVITEKITEIKNGENDNKE